MKAHSAVWMLAPLAAALTSVPASAQIPDAIAAAADYVFLRKGS
jgi:hypothetical protein